MPYVAAAPREFEQQSVGNGHCVAYARSAASMPPSLGWKQGAAVHGAADLPAGTAIATFDKNGKYGNHEDGSSHVAIYLGQNERGIQVLDQWFDHPVHERTIFFKRAARKMDDGRNYFVVE